MRRYRFASIRLALLPALLALLAYVGLVDGQPPPAGGLPLPRLLYIGPNGAKVGTTVALTLTGSDLDEAQDLLFSSPGFKAELEKEPEIKVDPKDKNKKPSRKKAQVGPTMSVTFKVTVPPNAPLGLHDVRLVNKWGVSNPRSFTVGDLNEVMEKEPNNDVEQAQRVEMNTTINGVIATPTDVDYFVFKGGKGQRIVLSCPAISIESKLHPVIELFEASGKKLGNNRDYRGTDAVLDCALPADGDYYARLSHFTHLQASPGLENFYRLSISTTPWIDAIFPPIVEPGKSAQLTIYGRNLPGGTPDPSAVLGGTVLEKAVVSVNVPNDPVAQQRLAYNGYLSPITCGLDGMEYRVKNAAGSSNPFLLTFARSPVVLDAGKNLTRETAQALNTPCEIAGRLDKDHIHAWYTFTAKKGENLSIELSADRLGSPIDLALGVYAADGKTLIELDDAGINDPEYLSNTQLYSRTSDPGRYLFKVPADGKYLLLVKSQEGTSRAGPRQLYRLRVSPEQPDFRLVLMAPSQILPEASVVRQGGNQEYLVYVLRRDGFQNDITMTVDGLPNGVTCKPQMVGPSLKQTALVVSAGPDAQPWTGEIKVKGTATVNGQPLVREARAASLTWAGSPQQQNIPLVSRMDRGVVLAVREKAPFAISIGQEKVDLPQGEKATLPLKVQRLWPDFKGPIQVTAVGLPTGMTVANTSVANDSGNVVLSTTAQVPPGSYNVVLRGSATVPFNKDPMAKQKANLNVVQASTPLTVTIVPKQLASLTVTPATLKAKVGEPAKVVVKVARMYNYPGEFKVELVLPPNSKGLSAPEVTIPAGKDEAELVITVASDADAGNKAGLLVRATAMFNGSVAVKHEAKFAINVQK